MSLYGIRTSDEVAQILNKAKAIGEFYRGNELRAIRRQRKFIKPVPTLRERLQAYKVKKLERANRLVRKQIAELRLQEKQKAEEERARRAQAILKAREDRARQRELKKWPPEKQRRCRINWRDLVPEDVAKSQERYERCQTILAIRESGMTLRAIGDLFGISPTTVRAHLYNAEWQRERARLSPVEYWMAEPATENRKEAKALKQIASLHIAPARDWLYV